MIDKGMRSNNKTILQTRLNGEIIVHLVLTKWLNLSMLITVRRRITKLRKQGKFDNVYN